jgi:4-hydroxy-3-polyprenylbenzoate decarboxylase
VYGVNSFFENKHFGCKGPLIIDARIKPHHAPPVLMNEEITKKAREMYEKWMRK